MTYIDTADVYGPHSNVELIRETLHPYPDGLVIATKGGLVRSGPEYADMGAVGTMTDAPFEEILETLAGMPRMASSATSASPTSAPTSSAPPCRSPTSPP